LMAICPRDERPRYARAAGRLAWPNGATSLLFSAEEPDRLRVLPTRDDLRSLDEHVAERLEALAARLDRLLGV